MVASKGVERSPLGVAHLSFFVVLCIPFYLEAVRLLSSISRLLLQSFSGALHRFLNHAVYSFLLRPSALGLWLLLFFGRTTRSTMLEWTIIVLIGAEIVVGVCDLLNFKPFAK